MILRRDLYFMIYPSRDAAKAAAEFWEKARSRPSKTMPAERLHVTLHPLDRSRMDHALRAGAAMDHEPFVVAFNRMGCRGGQGHIGTVEMTGQGPALAQLRRFQRELCECLVRAGFPGDRIRRSFNPHMTLDYRHPWVSPQTLPAPINWAVTELCLVESLVGEGRHEVLERWKLRPRQQTFSGREFDFPTNPRSA